ncbi:hypothetical protein FOMPIDRAFT_1054907 [Fomitopsis schrenkii]|uniref:Uncharacterized protein n=1 Tax=Fomitopsis schrenkii TaxID=2126942 RepID=S8F6U3_FOMSC|nr:hypothetical protein FOMPIDRAFT_1054907 [Fomitopsis schrenkii]
MSPRPNSSSSASHLGRIQTMPSAYCESACDGPTSFGGAAAHPRWQPPRATRPSTDPFLLLHSSGVESLLHHSRPRDATYFGRQHPHGAAHARWILDVPAKPQATSHSTAHTSPAYPPIWLANTYTASADPQGGLKARSRLAPAAAPAEAIVRAHTPDDVMVGPRTQWVRRFEYIPVMAPRKKTFFAVAGRRNGSTCAVLLSDPTP